MIAFAWFCIGTSIVGAYSMFVWWVLIIPPYPWQLAGACFAVLLIGVLSMIAGIFRYLTTPSETVASGDKKGREE